jgi:hypothetical protein
LASDTVNGVFLVDVSDLKSPKFAGNLVLPKRDPENPRSPPRTSRSQIPRFRRATCFVDRRSDGVLYISGTFTGLYIASFRKPQSRSRATSASSRRFPPSLSTTTKGVHILGRSALNPDAGGRHQRRHRVRRDVGEGLKIYRLAEGRSSR